MKIWRIDRDDWCGLTVMVMVLAVMVNGVIIMYSFGLIGSLSIIYDLNRIKTLTN